MWWDLHQPLWELKPMANVWKHINNGQSHKTIEWVKLIDYDYESGVKVWLRLIQEKCYEIGFEKVKDLGSRFLIWKYEDVCTISISSLKIRCEKV